MIAWQFVDTVLMNGNSKPSLRLMPSSKKQHPLQKSELHPRNRHRERYDFKSLITTLPELREFVRVNEYGDESIDFFDSVAVKSLNRALLKHFYNIAYWDIPKNYLCPPIPGRADYVHHAADLLASDNDNIIPRGPRINCLDIGVGANCIYPIIGATEYDWSFVGTDIETLAIESASHIVDMNPVLKKRITCRLQSNPKNIFQGVIKEGECFDLTVCNPPFHSSAEEAQSGTLRKLSNLKGKKVTKPVLNFGGKSNELWCEGGEEKFVVEMILESKQFGKSCLWFTTLISKRWNVNTALQALNQARATEVKTIPIKQGNKSSRIVAWTFLNAEERKKWAKMRWKSE
jgi:23S rRNA (adenine1618-N6)-methyltransferase